MPKINRNGVNIFYETYGEGPVVLLTHGFSATSKMWHDQIDFLSSDYCLVLWDMRGHGSSDYPEDINLYNEKETIEDMLSILDKLNVKKANIGGMSLGGYMSLAFYNQFPERVDSLIIIDTGPGFKNEEARNSWNNYAISTAEKFELSGLDSLTGRSKEMDPKNHLNAIGLSKAARGMLTQHDDRIIRSLEKISVPSLIIVGENDEPFLAASDYMERKIICSKKVVISDAGHAVNIDQPETFNQTVKEFLRSK
ncbi:MAG: alpha/beta fold hydrolase [Pseudomonadota bacterium]|nr:alpha/beta fold hydrolase [Pseudomonadota bacterium]